MTVTSLLLLILKVGVESVGIVAFAMLVYAVAAPLTGKRARK